MPQQKQGSQRQLCELTIKSLLIILQIVFLIAHVLEKRGDLLSPPIPLEVVAERLGHSAATTTQNIYIHPRPQHQQQAAEITETLLNKKPSIKVIEG